MVGQIAAFTAAVEDGADRDEAAEILSEFANIEVTDEVVNAILALLEIEFAATDEGDDEGDGTTDGEGDDTTDDEGDGTTGGEGDGTTDGEGDGTTDGEGGDGTAEEGDGTDDEEEEDVTLVAFGGDIVPF